MKTSGVRVPGRPRGTFLGKFAVGDLVVLKSGIHPHTSYVVDKVIAIVTNAYLVETYGTGFDNEVQQWDGDVSKPGERGWQQSVTRYQECQLVSLGDAKVEILRLEAEKASIELEFEKVRGEIAEKLKQAAKLVTEAASISSTAKKEFEQLTDEMRPLARAIKGSGWRMSTLECMY